MTTIDYFQAIILSGACGSGKTYASMVLLRQVIVVKSSPKSWSRWWPRREGGHNMEVTNNLDHDKLLIMMLSSTVVWHCGRGTGDWCLQTLGSGVLCVKVILDLIMINLISMMIINDWLLFRSSQSKKLSCLFHHQVFGERSNSHQSGV